MDRGLAQAVTPSRQAGHAFKRVVGHGEPPRQHAFGGAAGESVENARAVAGWLRLTFR